MNRLLFTSLLLSLLFVCGCSGNKYGWYKPGVTEGQINWDSRECLEKAEYRDNVGRFDAMREAELSGRPYTPYEDDSYRMSDDEFPRRKRQTYDISSCMKAKGYRWVLKDF
ncbi:MAG: hypothetical protein K9M75_01380 [Phycisphaerae bacterium]|nr:hypothetical protein [Phycisphaerae bacterium]